MTLRAYIQFLLKLLMLVILLGPLFDDAFALDEQFDLYKSPQGLAMGDALTADAMGYAANYYNPAGLAKANRKQWEIIPVALELFPSFGSLGDAIRAKSLSIAKIAAEMQTHPGEYYYHRAAFVPSFSRRGVGISFLGATQMAGRSDGTNYDVFATSDLGVNLGGALNLAGNLFKIGVNAKALVRRELKGVIAHTIVNDSGQVSASQTEGIGYGGDVGMLLTLPSKYLPTFGVAWKDALGTQFVSQSSVFGAGAAGLPSKIEQTVNAAVSIHPNLGKLWKMTVALEVKRLESSSIPILKRTHAGLQLENGRNWYLWAGLGQLAWSAGLGWRVPGGDLEMGSYGVDVGSGSARQENRRFFLRYTIDYK